MMSGEVSASSWKDHHNIIQIHDANANATTAIWIRCRVIFAMLDVAWRRNIESCLLEIPTIHDHFHGAVEASLLTMQRFRAAQSEIGIMTSQLADEIGAMPRCHPSTSCQPPNLAPGQTNNRAVDNRAVSRRFGLFVA